MIERSVKGKIIIWQVGQVGAENRLLRFTARLKLPSSMTQSFG